MKIARSNVEIARKPVERSFDWLLNRLTYIDAHELGLVLVTCTMIKVSSQDRKEQEQEQNVKNDTFNIHY